MFYIYIFIVSTAHFFKFNLRPFDSHQFFSLLIAPCNTDFNFQCNFDVIGKQKDKNFDAQFIHNIVNKN